MYSRWSDFDSYDDYRGPPLRQWQETALQNWEQNSFRGVIEAITGTGKSMVGIAAIRDVTAQGGYALVVVPTKALADQWVALIRKMLPLLTVGRFGDGVREDFNTKRVIVANVQSLRKPMPSKSLTLLVADEVHRYGAAEWAKTLKESFGQRLGLTATYERTGDDAIVEKLDPYFSGKVFTYPYAEALADGVVAPFNLAMVAVKFSTSEQAKYDESRELADKAREKLTQDFGYETDWRDFFSRVNQTLKVRHTQDPIEARLCARFMKGWSDKRMVTATASGKVELLDNVSEAFKERSGTLVFASTVDSVYHLAHVISKSASVVPLHGGSTNEERHSALESFRQKTIDVVCAPQILNEGIDVPDAEVAVIVGASQNRREMIQRMGRVIRLKDTNRCARILITYVEGTPEDPSAGGHEAFLEEVRPYAQQTMNFRQSETAEIKSWLSQEMPFA